MLIEKADHKVSIVLLLVLLNFVNQKTKQNRGGQRKYVFFRSIFKKKFLFLRINLSFSKQQQHEH